MAIPFAKGFDPRRNTRPPPPRKGPRKKSLMALCRSDRDGTVAALKRLRDQDTDRHIALAAATLMARYSDGEPGAHNVPPEMDEALEAEVDINPPALSPEIEAIIDGGRGGDAGDVGEGNGGAA